MPVLFVIMLFSGAAIMPNNSRDAILASMEGKSSTWGWGAITAFSRARVNNLIEQQFIEGYSEGRYFPFLKALSL